LESALILKSVSVQFFFDVESSGEEKVSLYDKQEAFLAA
jgi:hypothetical protein